MVCKEMTEEQRQRNNQYHREYYKAHKEQHRAAVKKWAEKNPKKAREINRKAVKKYYESHKEQEKARTAKWKKDHPEKYDYEKRKEYQKQYYQKNKKRISEQRRKAAANKVIVVRCKDCKYWHQSLIPGQEKFGDCGQAKGLTVKWANWFCADGEKRTD